MYLTEIKARKSLGMILKKNRTWLLSNSIIIIYLLNQHQTVMYSNAIVEQDSKVQERTLTAARKRSMI